MAREQLVRGLPEVRDEHVDSHCRTALLHSAA